MKVWDRSTGLKVVLGTSWILMNHNNDGNSSYRFLFSISKYCTDYNQAFHQRSDEVMKVWHEPASFHVNHLPTPFPQKLNNWTHVLLWNFNSSYVELSHRGTGTMQHSMFRERSFQDGNAGTFSFPQCKNASKTSFLVPGSSFLDPSFQELRWLYSGA